MTIRRIPFHWAVNKGIADMCVAASVGLYIGWNYAERGVAYTAVGSAFSTLQKAKLMPAHWHPPDPQRIWHVMDQKTVHRTGSRASNYEAAFWSNFSHKDLAHLAFNMIAFRSFAGMLIWMPTSRFAGLILGSAAASTAAFAYDNRGVEASGIGASGIVSGVVMASTFLTPRAPASILGIVNAPLWVLTGGFFLLDSYMAQTRTRTGIGHSAHLGGGVFGAAFYALFLRRYGGILGPRL